MPDRGAHADGRGVGGSRESAIGDIDGGVTQRLTRRCLITAAVLLGFSACLLLVILLRSWGTVSAALAVVAAGTLTAGAMLAMRAHHWSMIRSTPLPSAAGPLATIGPTRPLSPVRTGAPVRRKLGAIVVPIRVDGGAQPGGGALVVHARADSLVLVDADQVRCFTINGNSVEPAVPAIDEPVTPISGRFALLRVSDGAVFLGTTRLTDTW